ncbi:MAG: 2-succinyl-6-hydroxy-2,4-cyclohexadiene-1-carboxylate synthase [Chloroflexi bacterium]|nr:2-succinyl-6-hydroxy-2,4-cyclohexadiene-1-carboxylate synthase [Chloroflexota bacterium]
MTSLRVDGARLSVHLQGEGPALLLLHGFTGSNAMWTPHLAAFEGFTTVSVDLLGHGESDAPPTPNRYRMERCVDDLTSLLNHLEIERVAVLGYSMGGRVALQLALRAPGRLWALVLESASPGIDDDAEREDRVRSDAALADEIERNGIDAFVDRWQALPLFASQSRLSAAAREELRRQRLRNSPVGLANSLRGAGAGQEAPVLNRLGEIRIPTLLIAGALDQKYVALARKMSDALPCARTQIVSDAGHATHLEQPEAFDRVVREFLREHIDAREGKEAPPCQ